MCRFFVVRTFSLSTVIHIIYNLYLFRYVVKMLSLVVASFVLGLDAIVLRGYETMTHSLTVTICFLIQR